MEWGCLLRPFLSFFSVFDLYLLEWATSVAIISHLLTVSPAGSPHHRLLQRLSQLYQTTDLSAQPSRAVARLRAPGTEHKQPLAGASKQRQVAPLQLDGAPETPALLLLTTTQPPNLSQTYPHQPISTFTGRFLQARPGGIKYRENGTSRAFNRWGNTVQCSAVYFWWSQRVTELFFCIVFEFLGHSAVGSRLLNLSQQCSAV